MPGEVKFVQNELTSRVLLDLLLHELVLGEIDIAEVVLEAQTRSGQSPLHILALSSPLGGQLDLFNLLRLV